MSDQRRCPTCSRKVPPEAKFCRHCGTPVPGASAAASHANRRRKGGSNSSNRFLIGLLAVVLVVGAAGGMWYYNSGSHPDMEVDISSNMIPGAPEMPAWLMTANSEIKTEYTWAASHLAELQYMPCYCGCGQNGHADNFSCYFKRDGNGKIVAYDDMSFT